MLPYPRPVVPGPLGDYKMDPPASVSKFWSRWTKSSLFFKRDLPDSVAKCDATRPSLCQFARPVMGAKTNGAGLCQDRRTMSHIVFDSQKFRVLGVYTAFL